MASNKPPNDKQQPPDCQQHTPSHRGWSSRRPSRRNKCIPAFFAFIPSCVQDHLNPPKEVCLSRGHMALYILSKKKPIQDGPRTKFSCLLCDYTRLSIRVCLAEPRRPFKASLITAVERSMQPTRTPNTLHLPFAFPSELPFFP